MTSRIKRWTGIELGDAAATHRGLLGDAASARRIEGALMMALTAFETAQARRARADRYRHVVSGFEAVLGLTGLGGLVTIILSRVPEANLCLVGLLSVAAAVPMTAAIARTMASGRRQAEEIAAVEAARGVAVHAASLARTLDVATRSSSSEPGVGAVTEEVLAHIEQAAAALDGRERRLDIEPGSLGRRHVRIKPDNDRIAVTTAGGMTVIAQLVDVSISGAMIAGVLPDVRVGDEIRVGSRAATVVRTNERGVACEFVEPLPAHAFAPNVVL